MVSACRPDIDGENSHTEQQKLACACLWSFIAPTPASLCFYDGLQVVRGVVLARKGLEVPLQQIFSLQEGARLLPSDAYRACLSRVQQLKACLHSVMSWCTSFDQVRHAVAASLYDCSCLGCCPLHHVSAAHPAASAVAVVQNDCYKS